MSGFSITAFLGIDAKGVGRGLDEAAKKIGAFAGSIQGQIAGIVSAGAVISALKSTIDFAGSIQDASDAIGVEVEALQELQYAFGQSGAGQEVVSKGLAKLTQNLQKAREGNKEAIASFKALGVSWSDITTQSPERILLQLADGLKNATNPAAALSALLDVLGKSGLKMAAGLRSGSAELKKLQGEADKLGAEEIAFLDNIGDAISRLERKATVALGGSLKQLSEWAKLLAQPLVGGSAEAFIPKPGELEAEAHATLPEVEPWVKDLKDKIPKSDLADVVTGALEEAQKEWEELTRLQREGEEQLAEDITYYQNNRQAKNREMAAEVEAQLAREKQLIKDNRDEEKRRKVDDILKGPKGRAQDRTEKRAEKRAEKLVESQQRDAEDRARRNGPKGRFLRPGEEGPIVPFGAKITPADAAQNLGQIGGGVKTPLDGIKGSVDALTKAVENLSKPIDPGGGT